MEENTGRVSGLLFADDATLVAKSKSNLQRYVSMFIRMCERRKLKIYEYVGKSKVMKMSDTGEKGNLRIKVKEEVMEEVDTFRYLGVDFASNGRIDAELNHRIMEVRKCAGVLKSVWKNRNVSIETKRGMYEGIVVPTALYGSEAWAFENKVKNRVDVAEMSCLGSVCGVTKKDRVRNEEIRRRCRLQRSLSERGEAAVLRWLEHVKTMKGERLVKKIYQAEVDGNRGER